MGKGGERRGVGERGVWGWARLNSASGGGGDGWGFFLGFIKIFLGLNIVSKRIMKIFLRWIGNHFSRS